MKLYDFHSASETKFKSMGYGRFKATKNGNVDKKGKTNCLTPFIGQTLLSHISDNPNIRVCRVVTQHLAAIMLEMCEL